MKVVDTVFPVMRSSLAPGFLGLSLAIAVIVQDAAAQTSITADSPFALAPGTPDPGTGKDKYELAGISVVGKKTFVCLYDTEKKSNRWFSVGETSGTIEIVSCDVKADRAVVKIGGQSKVLSLRKAVVAVASPASITTFSTAPVTAETGPTTAAEVTPPAGPLTEQQVQEREARMLVSDLLEIGMQQRKAYEEKKAAQDAANKAAPAK